MWRIVREMLMELKVVNGIVDGSLSALLNE